MQKTFAPNRTREWAASESCIDGIWLPSRAPREARSFYVVVAIRWSLHVAAASVSPPRARDDPAGKRRSAHVKQADSSQKNVNLKERSALAGGTQGMIVGPAAGRKETPDQSRDPQDPDLTRQQGE